jgi:hypothetical protein
MSSRQRGEVSETPEIARRQRRAAELDLELANLQARHDLAMSAFNFGEANALQRRIEILEDERRAIAAALPPVKTDAEPPLGVVPVLTAPRRALRARRRR